MSRCPDDIAKELIYDKGVKNTGLDFKTDHNYEIVKLWFNAWELKEEYCGIGRCGEIKFETKHDSDVVDVRTFVYSGGPNKQYDMEEFKIRKTVQRSDGNRSGDTNPSGVILFTDKDGPFKEDTTANIDVEQDLVRAHEVKEEDDGSVDEETE